MQDVTDLERRITAALERIGRAATRGPELGADGAGEAAQLREALEEERMALAQAHERLNALQAAAAEAGAAHEAALNALRAEHASQSRDLVVMVKRMRRELAALYAQRSADTAEINGIVEALNPLIEEARNA